MDIVNQIAETDEEEAASVRDIRRKKSRRPKKQNALSQQFFIPQEVLNAKKTPQGEPLPMRYGFLRAEKMSCKFCDRPPFRTKIGLAVHMTDAHGVDSDGESDEDLEEVGVLRKSSSDFPCHLDYREPETNEDEASEDEVSEEDLSEQVTEVIDGVDDSDTDDEEEEVPEGQKRDTETAESTSAPVSKVMKINRNNLGNHRAGADAEDHNNNDDFIKETMDDFMKNKFRT